MQTTRLQSRPMKAQKIFLQGRVQAVGLRHTIRYRCEQLGIIGFALNKNDGTVEIHAQGAEDSLNKLVIYIETSPGISMIKSVETRECDCLEDLKKFRVK